MRKIRKGTFETNSSSTHALTIGTPLKGNYAPVGKYLKIRWIDTDDESVLRTLTDKVSYLVSHIANRYKYNAPTYEELIDEIKDSYDFQRIEDFVKEHYNKEIVFPKYTGDVEDVVEINHQLVDWNNSLDDLLADIVDYDRDYLAEVLQDGNDIEFDHD